MKITQGAVFSLLCLFLLPGSIRGQNFSGIPQDIGSRARAVASASDYTSFEIPRPLGQLMTAPREDDSSFRSDSKVIMAFNVTAAVVGQPFEVLATFDNTNQTFGGPFSVFDVVMQFNVPGAWSILGFSGNDFFQSCTLSAGTYVCDAQSVPAGVMETIAVVVTVSEAGTYELTLTSTQGSPNDPDTSNNTDTETIVVLVLGSISGKVYDDLNGNGQFDAGESPLSGVTVYLDSNLNGVLDAGDSSTVTDAVGDYSFTSLVDGAYTVRAVLPSTRVFSQPISGSYGLQILNGTVHTGINFGSFAPGIISGGKQNDLLADGTLDTGDPGIAGWTINLTGAASLTTQTNSSGQFVFDNLSPGLYSIAEATQTDWTQSVPSGGENYSFVVQSGSTFNTAFFGNWKRPGPLVVSKYNDLDRSGTNNDEPGLDGWTLFIDANGNAVLDVAEVSAVTGSSAPGQAVLQAQMPGVTSVCELGQEGWFSTNPGGSLCTTVTLESDVIPPPISFGNGKLGSISGTVFDDLNGDGNRGPSDSGVSGVVVFLDSDNNGFPGAGETQVTTGADGTYLFPNLFDDTYVVRAGLPITRFETSPVGWVYTVQIVNGSDVPDRDFGSYLPGSVSGVKWADDDGDALREPGDGELDLENWTIILKDSEGLELQRTQTDAAGDYTFGGLAPNMYSVAEDLFANWRQTFPLLSTGTTEHSVLIESGSKIDSTNFGNKPTQTDIKVIKTASENLVSKEDTVRFTVVVTNIGDDDAENVVLSDRLLAGFPFLALSTTKPACVRTDQTINCQLGTLAPGDSVTVQIDVRATSLGNQTNLATATTTSPDVNDLNNTSVAGVIVAPVILNITAVAATDMCFSDVDPLSDGVTDGNRVTITTSVTNGGTLKSETASLRLTDAETGRVLPDGDGSVGPFVVPQEQTVTRTYLWNTTGFAWKDDESQHPLPRTIRIELIHKGKVIQTEDRLILVRPKPIIMVHGLWADAAGWDSYPGFAKAKHDNWVGLRVTPVTGMDTGLFPLAALLEPSDTPRIFTRQTIQQNAGALKATIDIVRTATKSCHVDLVAHSMGGLISRDYIHRQMPKDVGDGEPLVKHLVQLGTPNEGSPCADDILASYGEMIKDPKLQAALEGKRPPNNIIELSTTHLKTAFNTQITNQKGVRFYILVGDLLPFTCRLSEQGDGVVPVSSAVGSTGGVPTFVGMSTRPMLHTSMSASEEVFNNFVKPILAEPPAGSVPNSDRYDDAPVGDPTRQFVSGQGTDAEYILTTVRTVVSGVPETITIPVSAATSFGVTYLAPLEVTSTLFDPTGVAVNTVKAGSQEASGLLRSHQVESPQTGSWTLQFDQTSADSVGILASVWVKGSSLSMTLATVARDPTQSVAMIATLTDAGVPVTGASVGASVAGLNTLETVALMDDGLQSDTVGDDGVYTGSFRPPENGRYLITADATSSSGRRIAALSVDLTNVSGVAVESVSDEIPDQMSLLPVYPNPTSGLTYVPFDVARRSRVDIRVYDLLGKEIATLVDRTVTPGKYETALTAAGLSPGLYIVRARIQGRIFSQMFTVVR